MASGTNASVCPTPCLGQRPAGAVWGPPGGGSVHDTGDRDREWTVPAAAVWGGPQQMVEGAAGLTSSRRRLARAFLTDRCFRRRRRAAPGALGRLGLAPGGCRLVSQPGLEKKKKKLARAVINEAGTEGRAVPPGRPCAQVSGAGAGHGSGGRGAAGAGHGSGWLWAAALGAAVTASCFSQTSLRAPGRGDLLRRAGGPGGSLGTTALTQGPCPRPRARSTPGPQHPCL